MNFTATMPNKLSTITREQLIGGSFLCAVILVIFVLIYSTVSWMTDQQRLPLSRLVMQGDLQHVRALDVQRSLVALEPLGTFMTQDVDQVQQAVQAQPWVAQVSIRKQWPDIIKVYIVEHQATAVWNGTQLLNQAGDIFGGDPSEVDDAIVKLYGPDDSSEEILQVWRDSSAQMQPLGRSITSVVLNDRHAWQMILDNGIRLELGKDSRDERLQRFIKLYHHLGDKVDQVSYIDLRYDTGAAVGWIDDDSAQERS
jgi:cell division protein FtsQ